MTKLDKHRFSNLWITFLRALIFQPVKSKHRVPLTAAFVKWKNLIKTLFKIQFKIR